MTIFRIATFNLENLGDPSGDGTALEHRIAALRPQLLRLDADILCLQEVNAQQEPGHGRSLRALDALLQETPIIPVMNAPLPPAPAAASRATSRIS
jgi:endonuclease/exonuclease/phosphatase family metal-dependent hydrolase